MCDAYWLLFCENVITVDNQTGEWEMGSDLGDEHIAWQLTRFWVHPDWSNWVTL